MTGFINSFVRTVFNVWFIAATVICYYLFVNANSLKTLTDALAKTTILKPLGTWIAANHNKSVGMVQQVATTMLVAPGSIALSMAVIGVILVYIFAAASNFLEYLGLSILLVWFARTRSPKIRLFIIIIFGLLYIYGSWGVQLLPH